MMLLILKKIKTKNMKWTDFFIKIYCLINGFKIKTLTTKEKLLASFHLKNKVNSLIYGLPPWEEKEEFIKSQGIGSIIGIYKKGQLIGSIHLMDLSQLTLKFLRMATFKTLSSLRAIFLSPKF